MNYEITHLRKGGFELDFVKHTNGNHYACATNFAAKCGMDWKYVNRIVNGDNVLVDASQKFGIRDSKNRVQKMVFINSDYFLYFLTLVKGLKVQNVDPNFVTNLILMYPLFVKELTKRAQVLFARMELNRTAQLRINKIVQLESFCRKEKSRLVKEMKARNIEDVVFDSYNDGSVQAELEIEDKFYRNVEEVEAEVVE